MPQTDSKRLNFKGETKPIAFFIPEDKRPLLEAGKRLDGRKYDEFRSVFLQTGYVTRAKGSAYVESNGTKVVSSVTGPKQSDRRQEFSAKGWLNCEFSFSPFSQKIRRVPGKDTEHQQFSSLLLQTLEPSVRLETFPKSSVDVTVTVLEDDGSAFSLGVMCASLALADAGIELIDMVTSCTLAFDGKHFLLDPTTHEISHSSTIGQLTIGYMPLSNEISFLEQSGEFEPDQCVEAVQACIGGCLRMHSLMRNYLIEDADKNSAK